MYRPIGIEKVSIKGEEKIAIQSSTAVKDEQHRILFRCGRENLDQGNFLSRPRKGLWRYKIVRILGVSPLPLKTILSPQEVNKMKNMDKELNFGKYFQKKEVKEGKRGTFHCHSKKITLRWAGACNLLPVFAIDYCMFQTL